MRGNSGRRHDERSRSGRCVRSMRGPAASRLVSTDSAMRFPDVRAALLRRAACVCLNGAQRPAPPRPPRGHQERAPTGHAERAAATRRGCGAEQHAERRRGCGGERGYLEEARGKALTTTGRLERAQRRGGPCGHLGWPQRAMQEGGGTSATDDEHRDGNHGSERGSHAERYRGPGLMERPGHPRVARRR